MSLFGIRSVDVRFSKEGIVLLCKVFKRADTGSALIN